MSKIYVVNESSGSWDDFYTHPVKAFITEEKAKELVIELDKSHERPEFITDELSNDYNNWLGEWDENNPYDYSKDTDEYSKEYDIKWERDRNNYLKEKGLTDEQIKIFIKWEDEDRFVDWNQSFITEIELEENA